MVKTLGKYEFHRTLGEGSFGKVKYAVNIETNEAVAIKVLDKEKIKRQSMANQIKKEIALSRQIDHKHVVKVLDVFASASKVYLVLELVEGGELFDKIAEDGPLSEAKARHYMSQLVSGIECCHSKGICHRDLKTENLLLDSNGDLKISDFGLATLYVGDSNAKGDARATLLHTTCGTPHYLAPEVLSTEGYNGLIADIWSMGVIMFVMLAAYLPFDEDSTAALFVKIQVAQYQCPPSFSPAAQDLLRLTLVPDPTKRITLAELKAHPWMTEAPFTPSVVVEEEDSTETKASGGEGIGAAPEAAAAAAATPPTHKPLKRSSDPAHHRSVPAKKSVGSTSSSDAGGPFACICSVFGLGGMGGEPSQTYVHSRGEASTEGDDDDREEDVEHGEVDSRPFPY